ncbi:MAG: Smr/MutS family protein [Rectinemataceae bacterium]
MDVDKYFESWLSTHAIPDKDNDPAGDEQQSGRGQSYARFKSLEPQAILDLHGMGAQDARMAVRAFLARSAAAGLEKVLIIHGKGNHSQQEAKLVGVVREELEHSVHAGAFGFADSRHGGRGATWARVRATPYFSR